MKLVLLLSMFRRVHLINNNEKSQSITHFLYLGLFKDHQLILRGLILEGHISRGQIMGILRLILGLAIIVAILIISFESVLAL